MTAKPQFRLFGIPVRIEPLFWVIAVFLALNLQEPPLIITWVGVVLVSVLVHEFGHALALKAFGQSSSIVLHGFGGLTFSQRRLGRGQSIAVSLAGPLSALVLLGVPSLLIRESDFGLDLAFDHFESGGGFGLWPVVVFAAYVNIWWSIANLLPIRPLDGGNVLTEIVGLQPARLVSAVVGAVAAVWAYTHSTDFQMAAFFAGFLAFTNLSEYRRAGRGVRAPSTFDIDAPAPPGGGGIRPGSLLSPSSTTRPPTRDGWPTSPPVASVTPIDAPAAERLGWNLLRTGELDRAASAVARAGGTVDPFLAGTITAARTGDVTPLTKAYLAHSDGPTNLVVAQTAAVTGYLDELVRALLASGPAGIDAVHSIQTHLHYGGSFAAAAAVGEALHTVTPARAQVAFDTATALSRAGDGEQAMRWLRRAVDDGFTALGLLDGEPDLAPLRSRDDWRGFRDALGPS